MEELGIGGGVGGEGAGVESVENITIQGLDD